MWSWRGFGVSGGCGFFPLGVPSLLSSLSLLATWCLLGCLLFACGNRLGDDEGCLVVAECWSLFGRRVTAASARLLRLVDGADVTLKDCAYGVTVRGSLVGSAVAGSYGVHTLAVDGQWFRTEGVLFAGHAAVAS